MRRTERPGASDQARRATVTAGLLMMGGLFGGCASTAQEREREQQQTPRLSGTVVQFNPQHNLRTRGDWERLFRSLRALGMTQIVVQWTVDGTAAYYPSQRFRAGPMPPLDTLLDLAEATGMRMLVGLAHDPQYWSHIVGEPAQVAHHLGRLRERSLRVARELAPRLAHRRAFEGWYLSEEIDDLNWRDPARRAIVSDHLQALTSELRTLDARARIAISGFANAGTDRAVLQAFWDGLLAEAPELGVVMFQDGVGVGKLSLEELPDVLAAVQRAVEGRRRELRVIVEVFRQTAGAPIDDRPFAAEPAPIERVRRQIAIARSFSTGLLAFTVPDYMNPDDAPAKAQLYEEYRRACVEGDC
jgi:hypothetical protein